MVSPVVLLVFNRPELTARVFARIREARPTKLLVVCDGPRADRPDEALAVASVRRTIDEGVDWPCEVLRNYADTNMGCRARVSSGLTWAFTEVPEAIVLEDDCLPDPSFFPYCDELLERYRDEPRVLHIGANHFTSSKAPHANSYDFSRYGHIWGWATWRRAWQLYEWDIHSWRDPATRSRILARFDLSDERGYWGSLFDRCAARAEKETTWDYQWTYTCWKHEGLAIYPSVHLVQNIGQGVAGATHTHLENPLFGQPAESMPFPLRHPARVEPNAALDRRAFRAVFMPRRPWLGGIWRGLRRRFLKSSTAQNS